MNKQILIGFLLLLISLCAHGQYSGTGPITLSLPSNVTGIRWYKNGVYIPDSTQRTFTTSVPGTYQATYAESATSCELIQSNYFVLVSGGGSIQLDGQTNNGGGTGYQWMQNGIDISGANSANYTTNVGGLYVLKYNNGTCDLTTTPYYVFRLCGAGTVPPALSAVTLSNICPTETINLTTITASNLPSGLSMTWHTGTPATDANKVATSTAVGAGTYYAAFYDSANGCYSPTALVTATAASCASGVIDCSKTQLYPAPVVGVAGQKVLYVTLNVSTSKCFTPLSVSGSGFSLGNGATQVCTSTTGVQQMSIPVYYNGSSLGTMNFTVGSSGSCSADLTTTPKKAVVDMWTIECLPTQGPVLR